MDSPCPYSSSRHYPNFIRLGPLADSARGRTIMNTEKQQQSHLAAFPANMLQTLPNELLIMLFQGVGIKWINN